MALFFRDEKSYLFFYNILVGEVCEARGAWEASGRQRMHCEVNDATI